MRIIPAIDIIEGSAVRLYKGEYSKKEVVDCDVLKRAQEFELAGADMIHIVDLDGAKTGKLINKELIASVIKSVSTPVEVGGGIRTEEDVDFYINNGASRVILGTSAIEDIEMLKKCVGKYKEKIVVGIDFKDGNVYTRGWLQKSERKLIELGEYLKELGVESFVVTDISKDGTLLGTNIKIIEQFADEITPNVVASGGVKDINDIKELLKLNIYGAIIGKALYSGKIDLKEAVQLAHAKR